MQKEFSGKTIKVCEIHLRKPLIIQNVGNKYSLHVQTLLVAGLNVQNQVKDYPKKVPFMNNVLLLLQVWLDNSAQNSS